MIKDVVTTSKNNHTKKLIDQIDKMLPDIFKDLKERKAFLAQLTSLYLNDHKLKELDQEQVVACALQLFLKGANMENGEGFIIGYKHYDKATKTTTKIATTQTGYKFALKKLFQSGLLRKYPEVTEVKQSDLESFNPHTHEAKIVAPEIKTAAKYQEWLEAPVIGYQVTFEMKDPKASICKFFWKDEVLNHIDKWSKSYQEYKKWKNPSSIWATSPKEMVRKNALMRTYTRYLPKTENKDLYAATKDIDALNFAAYKEIDPKAKPHFIDNPHDDNQKPAPELENKPRKKVLTGGLTPDLQVPPSGITPKTVVDTPPLFFKDLPVTEKNKLSNHRLIVDLEPKRKVATIKVVWQAQKKVRAVADTKIFDALPIADFYKLITFMDGFKDLDSLLNYAAIQLGNANPTVDKTTPNLPPSNGKQPTPAKTKEAELDQVNQQIQADEEAHRDQDDIADNINWTGLEGGK